MRVLALDSTTRAGSVALVVVDARGNVTVDERAGDASRTHGERLPGELAALGAPWATIDVFAVASGPGSFTGLRIGIATVQGLALATGRSVVGVSTLEALAQCASARLATGALVGAWVDAQRSAGKCFQRYIRLPAARCIRQSGSWRSNRRRWPRRRRHARRGPAGPRPKFVSPETAPHATSPE
jgi:tRNA threonylcarbamoyl adenosine modification protein YeaZ